MIQRVTLDISYDPDIPGGYEPGGWAFHELLDLTGAPNDNVRVVSVEDPRPGVLDDDA